MRTTSYMIVGLLLVLLVVSFGSMVVALNDHGILMSRGDTSGMIDSMIGVMPNSMMNGTTSGMMRGYASLMGRMMVRSTMPALGISALRFMLWPGLLLMVAGGGLLAGLAIARQAQSVPAATQSVLDILNLRYAKGEINKEQFEEMRHNLKP